MDTQRAGLSWKQWLLGIVVLTISLALAGAVILAIYKLFARLPSQVATAVTAIIAAGLGAAVTAILTKRSERRMEIERQIREEKIPIYESFLAFWFKLVPGKGMPQNTMAQEEMIEFLREFTQKMITWGSDDVLKVYCKMRKSLVEQANSPTQSNYGAILLLEEMLYAIRRDLGHKNNGLSQGDVLALFIDDVDTILPPRSSR